MTRYVHDGPEAGHRIPPTLVGVPGWNRDRPDLLLVLQQQLARLRSRDARLRAELGRLADSGTVSPDAARLARRLAAALADPDRPDPIT
jgi:hypothetical protein